MCEVWDDLAAFEPDMVWEILPSAESPVFTFPAWPDEPDCTIGEVA